MTSSLELSEIPSLILSYGSITLTASSESILNYSELFYEPLAHFCQTLQNHFSICYDIGISFPNLELNLDMNSVYAEEFSLAHIYSLHQGLFLSEPFLAVIKEKKLSFVSRYNYLLSQLPPINGEKESSIPVSCVSEPPNSSLGVDPRICDKYSLENLSSVQNLILPETSLERDLTDDRSSLLAEIVENNNTNPQDNHEYEPQDEVINFTPQINLISSNPSCLEADEDVDLSEGITPENSLYENNLSLTHRSKLLSSESLTNISDLTEGDYSLNQIIPKSLDVGEEDIIGDEDIDIFGNGEEELKSSSESISETERPIMSAGECVGVGVKDLPREQNITNSLYHSQDIYEEINESEEEGHVVHPMDILSPQQDSDSVMDSPLLSSNFETTLYNKSETQQSLNSIKRKPSERDYLSDEASSTPLLKRTRLNPPFNDERKPSPSPSITSDSVVIFVNDIEEELDDSDLDLGLYEEIPSF